MRRDLRAIALVALIGGAMSPAAVRAEARSHDCNLADVTVFKDRVHVRCSNPASDGAADKIHFFVVPASNPAAADRFLSTALTALVSGKTFAVRYDTDATKDGFGASASCRVADCRVPYQFTIR